jgi:hypothetical protein
MDLYKDMLIKLLEEDKICVTFPDVSHIIESECYQALKKIKAVIEDDSLDDPECFMRIEEIIYAFEALGSNAGGRHDY